MNRTGNPSEPDVCHLPAPVLTPAVSGVGPWAGVGVRRDPERQQAFTQRREPVCGWPDGRARFGLSL